MPFPARNSPWQAMIEGPDTIRKRRSFWASVPAEPPAKTATITAGTKAEDVLAFVFANDAYILLVVHTAGVPVDAAQFFGTFQLP